MPRGTGWDFVRTFGVPRNVEQAARVALAGNEREVDLGLVTYRAWAGDELRAAFANVASVGMSGAIAARANETSKALGGKASYLWATFRVFAAWSPTAVRVTVDGERREGRMTDVVVANGRFFGGGMKICPEAEPDDGLFDVLTIGDVTKRDLVATMPKIYRGTHLPHPKGELLRGSCRHDRDGRAAPDPARRRAARHDPGAVPGAAAGAAGPGAVTTRTCARPARLGLLGPLERRELLLELRDPRLERVDAAHLLAQLVDARAKVVERLQRPAAAGQVYQAGEGRLPLVREPGERVVVALFGLLRRRHADIPTRPAPRRQLRMRTGVPSSACS